MPEALCNYLLRLGWGHGDEEILSRKDQIRLFDLDGVGRSPSRMDYAKLTHVNGYWLRQADDVRLTKDVLSRLKGREDLDLSQNNEQKIKLLMPGLKERAKNLNELAENASFLCMSIPLNFTDKAQKLLNENNRALLSKLVVELNELPEFTKKSVNSCLHAFAEKENLKLGKVAQPLRAAVTGSTMSPGIDDTLLALGKNEVLARLGAVING